MKGSGLTITKPLFPGTSAKALWNHPGISHGWVEFHSEKGWEAVDASLANVPFLRKLFFNSHAHLLLYGDTSVQKEIFVRDLQSWAEKNGKVVGGMSAPIRFSASMNPGTGAVVPEVKVKKRWFSAKTEK